jgi:hypothetical protein
MWYNHGIGDEVNVYSTLSSPRSGSFSTRAYVVAEDLKLNFLDRGNVVQTGGLMHRTMEMLHVFTTVPVPYRRYRTLDFIRDSEQKSEIL